MYGGILRLSRCRALNVGRARKGDAYQAGGESASGKPRGSGCWRMTVNPDVIGTLCQFLVRRRPANDVSMLLRYIPRS